MNSCESVYVYCRPRWPDTRSFVQGLVAYESGGRVVLLVQRLFVVGFSLGHRHGCDWLTATCFAGRRDEMRW